MGQKTLQSFLVLLALFFASSCVEQSAKSGRSARGAVSNNSSTVSVGYGRILHDNPIILSGNYNLSPSANLNAYLKGSQDFITTSVYLQGSCDSSNISSCFEVKATENSSVLQTSDGKWAFSTSSQEFLQVNTFGHIKLLADRFHTNLQSIYASASPFAPVYTTAIPSLLYTNKAQWKHNASGNPDTLEAVADCNLVNNALYSPAKFQLCFGTDLQYSTVKFAQDSTVIYHELGHALIQVMLNMRNAVGGVVESSNIGSFFYDEAGGVAEGVSDYFSYIMNGRTHMGEWALGRFNNQSRPLSEDESVHAPGISTSNDSRLSYPAFLNYDPNNPSLIFEDVHYAGQIISHYLVALTTDLQNTCGMSQKEAANNVLYLLNETFAELGDLTTKGSDASAVSTVNLDVTNAYEWFHRVRPLNYRSFAQTMAKYLKNIFGNASLNRCNGGIYPQDNIEQLLDHYGLLLFKTYNEDGNNSVTGHAGTHTAVTNSNRIKSVLINKDLLKLDPDSNAIQGFVLDDQTTMKAVLASLQSTGQIGQISSLIDSELSYNNANGQISPGEVIGLSLNVYNDSNSPMAGVQVLANDWDHIKESKPCNTFSDAWPLSSEGAAQLTVGEGAVGGCDYITRSNGADGDLTAPVCFVQVSDTNSTLWTKQGTLRTNMSLDISQCLDTSDDSDCFIRAIPGADHAHYSKIDPKKTWGETIIDSSGNPQFSLSNYIFFEVSPWIPPGTTFNCRFRARFTNCDNCYHDSTNGNDDYLDYEFSGNAPYKIINFQFTVIN